MIPANSDGSSSMVVSFLLGSSRGLDGDSILRSASSAFANAPGKIDFGFDGT